MAKSANITWTWHERRNALVTVHGDPDDWAVERLDHVLQTLVDGGAETLTVDIARVDGADSRLLEPMARACRQLWRRRGSMHLVGLRDRLASRPEVAAFPELFGTLDTGAVAHSDPDQELAAG
jgi:anti-anti-sigma regulatory factor